MADWLPSLFERATDGLLLIDPDSLELLEFNRAAHESLGYSREEFRALGVAGIQAEERPEWLRDRLREILERGRAEFTNRHRARDGSIRHVWLSHRLVGDGERRYIATVVQDLTDLMQMRELLDQAEELSQLGSWELNLGTGRLIWSAQTYRIFEISPGTEAPSYEAFLERVHPEDRQKVDRTYRLSVQTGEIYQLEHRLRFPDGREKVVLERGRTEYDGEGRPLRSLGTVQDITELAIARQRLATLAYRDPLTGLPNRESSLSHLRELCCSGESAAVLALHLDGYRRVCDSISREAGEQLLCSITGVWDGWLAPGDWLARTGEEEFLVIRAGVGSDEARTLAGLLQQALAEPLRLPSGLEVKVSVAGGISLAPEHGEEPEVLLQRATVALQMARQCNRTATEVYDVAFTTRVRNRLEQEVRLQQALTHGEIFLVYQPQVDAEGTLVGMEALLRWHDPLVGPVSPAEFIPLAEQSDLIQLLGRWALEQACAQLQRWNRAGLTVPSLAVNLSPRQLAAGAKPLLELLRALLETYGIRPGQLELEITESSLLPQQGHDPVEALRALREMGVGLAIDDFGTGYSSLQLLQILPVQKLKIDRSFVTPLTRDAADQTIVRTIVLMARGLGLHPLAEGVETEAQVQLLSAMGCHHFQGFRFSPPLTAEEMTRRLAGQSVRTVITTEESQTGTGWGRSLPLAPEALTAESFLLLPGDGLLLVLGDGRIAHLNREARAWLGSRSQDWSGQLLGQVWPELAYCLEEYREAIARGPLDATVTLGEENWRLRLFRTDDGYGVGLLTGEELEVGADPQLALLSRVLDGVEDAVLVTTAEPFARPGPIILYANAAALRQTGYRAAEVLGRSPRLFQGPDTDPEARAMIAAAMHRWQPVRQELLNYRRDGTPFWVELDLAPVADAEGWFTHWVSVQREVTERHRREQVLIESERFLRLADENSAVGRCLNAPDGRFLHVNAAFCRFVGLSAETLSGLRWQDLATADELPEEESLAAALMAGTRSSYRLEKQYLRPDGSRVWGDMQVSCVRDDDGTVRHFIAQIADITEQRQLESQLDASEARLQKLIDGLPIALAVSEPRADAAARILRLNDQFLRAFGYRREELPTLGHWLERAYPDEVYRQQVIAVWQAAVKRALASSGRVESMEFRVTCRDGQEREVLIGAVVVDDQLVVSLTDITERRRAEAELRSVRALLERTAYELTENIPVGTYTMVMPPDGQLAYFSFMSSRFLEITGLDAERARAHPLNAFACVHPEDYDDWVRLNAETFEKRLPFYGETRLLIDGEVRWISAESNPRQLPDGATVWEGVLIDITARKRAELELQQASAEAEQSNRKLQQANRELLRLATTDALTRVWNRRHFEEMVQAELQRCQRYDEPLCLVLFDVDRFKAINDRCGHLAGDRVLAEVARRVREQLREVDGLGRWGGEEFAVYLPHTELTDALHVAEKLRLALAEREFPGVGTVTASFGVARYRPDESLEECLRRADDALYQAKHQGRNRVSREAKPLDLAG